MGIGKEAPCWGSEGGRRGWLGYRGRDWHRDSVSSCCPGQSVPSPSLPRLLYAEASPIHISSVSLGAGNLNACWTLPLGIAYAPQTQTVKGRTSLLRVPGLSSSNTPRSHLPKPRAWGQAKGTSSPLLSPSPPCSPVITFATCLPSFAIIAVLVDFFSFFLKNRLYF